MRHYQKLFCCICAKEFSSSVHNTVHGYFKQAVCSRECLNEKDWREALSIMDHEYTPDPRKNKNDESK